MGSKMPIEWHEDCLKNRQRTLEVRVGDMDRLTEIIKRMRGDIEFYRLQILTAKREKRDVFDEDKFLKKRTKKVEG